MPTMRETMSRMLSSRMSQPPERNREEISSYRNGPLVDIAGCATREWCVHHLQLAALEWRQFVFVLFLPPANNPLLQETLGQASAPHAECDCQAEHQGAESNSECNQHGLFCETQFFKDDGQHENYDDAADSEAQNPR